MKNLNINDPVEQYIIERLGYVDGVLLEIIENINDKNLFMDFLLHYSHYNDQFAPGVIAYASKVHFALMDEFDNAAASKIAATIYSACDHEYHEHVGDLYFTHGELSKNFRDTLIKHFEHQDVSQADFEQVYYMVRQGYHVYETSNPLATGLGFHMASESLASLEFYTLNRFMMKAHNDIFTTLTYNSELDGVDAQHWVAIHASVEEEHFMDALKSYRRWSQLITLNGTADDLHTFQNHILEGFKAFETVQERFYSCFSEYAKTKHQNSVGAAANV